MFQKAAILASGNIPAAAAEASPVKIVAFFGTLIVFVSSLKAAGINPSRAKL